MTTRASSSPSPIRIPSRRAFEEDRGAGSPSSAALSLAGRSRISGRSLHFHGGDAIDPGRFRGRGRERPGDGRFDPVDMKIIATRSVDGGATWGPSTIVVSGLNPFAPAVAARPNGTAHIVWWAPLSAVRPGGNILTSRSTDRGATWGVPVRVNPVAGSALFYGGDYPNRIPYPWPATNSGGSLFVAWADKEKLSRRSRAARVLGLSQPYDLLEERMVGVGKAQEIQDLGFENPGILRRGRPFRTSPSGPAGSGPP
jgi:hypothetical protein